MVKKIIDMRNNGLLEELTDNEKILNVYFLIEEEKSMAYHLVTILVKTNLAIYVARRGNYSFESSGGGKSTIKDVLRQIFKKQNSFDDFSIFCVKNKDLNEIEDEKIIEINKLPEAIDCKDIVEYNFQRFKKFINEIKK